MDSSQSTAKVRDRAALPVAENALPRSQQLRLSLIGIAIWAVALGACVVLGLVIRAAAYGA
jgi:uncharacterized membrane protein YphA (DoxX/SURF4 family)